MSQELWGPGGRAKTEKAFATVAVGSEVAELVFGEHPHSRSDNNVYARFPDGRIEGFSGHRVLWGVQSQEFNHLKQSGLSGNEVREGCTTLIFANGIQVYELFSRQLDQALREAQRIITKLENLPVKIWDEKQRRELVGRKVYWRHEPAFVSELILGAGCVILKPDGMRCFDIPPWRDLEDEIELINTEIIDKNIWWWRK